MPIGTRGPAKSRVPTRYIDRTKCAVLVRICWLSCRYRYLPVMFPSSAESYLVFFLSLSMFFCADGALGLIVPGFQIEQSEMHIRVLAWGTQSFQHVLFVKLPENIGYRSWRENIHLDFTPPMLELRESASAWLTTTTTSRIHGTSVWKELLDLSFDGLRLLAVPSPELATIFQPIEREYKTWSHLLLLTILDT